MKRTRIKEEPSTSAVLCSDNSLHNTDIHNNKRVKKWKQATLPFGWKIKSEAEENAPPVIKENPTQEHKQEPGMTVSIKQPEIDFDIKVKQEKDPQSIEDALKEMNVSDFLPDPEDPNNYCRVCDITHSVKRTLRLHCINVHKMNLPPRPKILQKSLIAKFSNIMPDPEDPDYNCCVCQQNYSDKYNYRRHLRNCHKMNLAPLTYSIIKNPNSIPDEDDPNLYCASCERKFRDRYAFRSHLSSVHNLSVRSGQRAKKTLGDLPEEDDPNGYCRVCDKKLESLRSYRNHLRAIHDMVLKPRGRALRIVNRDLEPDENNINNHCTVCKKTYSRRPSFRVHLETIHNMVLQNPEKKMPVIITEDSPIKPDPNNPEFYCLICDKSYLCQKFYRTHLIKAHKMVLPPLNCFSKKKSNDTSLPGTTTSTISLSDQSDQDFLKKEEHLPVLLKSHETDLPTTATTLKKFICELCDRAFSRKDHLKSHLKARNCKLAKIIAQQKAPVPKDPSANIKPDVDDPNFFCCVCQKNSPDKRTFDMHLKIVHELELGNITYSSLNSEEPLPDIHHPEFYCSLCKRNLSCLDNFHRHLRTNHKMKFKIPRRKHFLIPHPELTPDKFNPDLYCCACEKKFSCASGFRNHLRRIHKMAL